MIEICTELSISRLKIGVAMAISLDAIFGATATLILFLDAVFELIEGRISLYIFF